MKLRLFALLACLALTACNTTDVSLAYNPVTGAFSASTSVHGDGKTVVKAERVP